VLVHLLNLVCLSFSLSVLQLFLIFRLFYIKTDVPVCTFTGFGALGFKPFDALDYLLDFYAVALLFWICLSLANSAAITEEVLFLFSGGGR